MTLNLKKNWRRIDIDIPVLGMCTADVYMKHDQWYGRSKVFPHDEHIPHFITPNMPNLDYFFDFEYIDRGIKPLNLLEILEGYTGEISVDAKRDGFCVLFYPVYDSDWNLLAVLSKSRKLPVAKGGLLEITVSEHCPTNKIEDLVSDGYVPVFECWGPGLEKYDVGSGCSDKHATVKLEHLPDINFNIISILKNNYKFADHNNYTPTNFAERQALCHKYGLNCVKSYGLMTLEKGKVTEAKDTGLHNVSILDVCKKSNSLRDVLFGLYELFDDVNKEHGAIITEGGVLHTRYGMFKLKSKEVMLHDVEVAGKVIPEDVVLAELSKVKLERSVDDFIYRTNDIIMDVVMYLNETHEVTNKNISNIEHAVMRETYSLIQEHYPDATTEFAGRNRWHKLAIASLYKYG